MRSLRNRIVLITGIFSFLALAAGVTITLQHYENKVRRQSAKELRDISRSTVSMIEAVGSGLTNLGRAISASDKIIRPLKTSDVPALRASLEENIRRNSLDYADITDQSGRVVTSLYDSLAAAQPSLNPVVHRVLEARQYYYGILRIKDRIHVAATLPILDGSNLLGTITIGRTFDGDLIRRLENVPGVHLAVWENSGFEAIVAAGNRPLPPLENLLKAPDLDRLLAGESVIGNLSIDGRTYQVAYFAEPELGGKGVSYCAVYRSLEFLQEAGKLTLIHLSALSLLLLILAVGLAWWVSLRVTQPLSELTAVTRRMADSNFSESVPVRGRDEIGQLAVSFNDLSRSLQESISQKDRYAAELAKLNEQLEELVAERTEELENANIRLKRAVAENEDFLRAVSHDLGAPLRNIAGLVRMLERKQGNNLDDEGRDRLARIHRNVENELQLIEQLLELSRIKTRRGRPTEMDLQDLLGQIREDFSFLLEERGIKISITDVLPMIHAEKNRIRQVFQNLIDNAIKYVGVQKEPHIEIGWTEFEKSHLFWVQDNGMGIPADQLNKIFHVFRRVKSKETSEIEGKGIGLTSAKAIVEMYGGDIWVESEPGKGSTFYFTLEKARLQPDDNVEPIPESEVNEVPVPA